MTYPLLRWNMYSSRGGSRQVHRLLVHGTDWSGHYPFWRLMPLTPGPLRDYTVPSPLLQRLIMEVGKCRCNSGSNEADRLLWVLANVRWSDPDSPIEGMTLERRVIDPYSYTSAPWRVIYQWKPLGLTSE
jgi:hypothetical protein